jgi:hypothetical protein
VKTLRWFGVKTLYRARAIGRPRLVDQDLDPSASLIEERVVLIRARDFDEAIRKAEREAGQYVEASSIERNAYGQRVRWRYLRVADAFELASRPAASVEVHSNTYVLGQERSDAEIVSDQFGPKTEKSGVRKNFVV